MSGRINKSCGNCNLWMKNTCPREVGERKPTWDDSPCSKWEPDSMTRERISMDTQEE